MKSRLEWYWWGLHHFALIIPRYWLVFILSAFCILNVAQTSRGAVIVKTQVPCQIEISFAIRYQLSKLSKYDCHICWKCIGQAVMRMRFCYFRLIFLMLAISVPTCRLGALFSPFNKAWTVLTFVPRQQCPFRVGPLLRLLLETLNLFLLFFFFLNRECLPNKIETVWSFWHCS